MEKDELKELDLTLVDIANQGMSKELYDSFLNNSIQDEQGSKRQRCYGEKYVGKGINVALVKKVAIICASCFVYYLVAKGFSAAATIDQYYMMLNQKSQAEFNVSAQEVTKDLGIDYMDILENHKETYNSLPSSEYDIYGSRKDKDHEYDRDIENELYYHTDKHLDAQEIITDNTMDEYRELKNK